MLKDDLESLVNRFIEYRACGNLENASEASMRVYIDELLKIFGWDTQNTRQVLMEHTLDKAEREKLKNIGSTNIRPDYTLVNGKVPLIFVDAKSLDVDIENSREVAFQIRSYGWSIGAPYSIVTNFAQLAIYDCSRMPSLNDDAAFARPIFLIAEDYAENFDTLFMFLSRREVLSKRIKPVAPKGESLDERFSKFLGRMRVDLAKAILDKNNVPNVRVLSYYVQTIINRVLFIRVCESRGLEKDGLLQTFMKGNFWEAFKKSSYGDFYDHYDGPMFKKIPNLQSLEIDNEVFESFLSNLYYPSPYRFDVIPLKTLSDIYDLFLGYQLVVSKNIVFDELKEEFKKSNGAVTTPGRLVEQVIESTLQENIIGELSIEQCYALKTIDIACGSGVFLVGIYDYLVKEIEKKLAHGAQCDATLYTNLDRPTLNIEGRRKLINDCIYGVDINPEAVEVSKMSLCLRLIDNYTPKDFEAVGLLGSQILKGIGSNIKCGNSLVENDIVKKFPSIESNLKELQETNAFDWKMSFPEVFENGGFDFIVGNPPYVEVKNYNTGLPHMAEYIKKVYASSKNGKIDLAIPFIEKGVSLLNQHGRLGYIVQKRFFKTDYGKGIRKLLTKQNKLNGVYDYVETDLFAHRLTYVAVVVCDNDKKNNQHVWYMKSDSKETQLLKHDSLSDTPWNFENAVMNALRMRLTKNLGTLKDICNVKVGVQVLWNDAFQVHVLKIKDGLIHGYTAIDDNVIIEEAACRPLLCNERFAPLTKREYTTYAIFPYDVIDGSVEEITIQDYTERFPLAGAYLEKHKKLICSSVETLPAKDVKDAAKNRNRYRSAEMHNEFEHWHLFTRANNHGATYAKLAVPMTAQYPQAAVVLDENVYCDNANMFFVQIPEATKIKLYALSALINSTVFCTFARSIANPQQGGYYKFNKQFLDPVPVPKEAFLDCDKDIEKLAKLAMNIEKINEQIKCSEGGQTSGLVTLLSEQWAKLDKLCDKLYGLSTEEKALIYSTPRFDRNPYGQTD